MDPLISTGQPAPDFELLDLYGIPRSLKEFAGRVVVVNFWSAECPHSARADLQLSGHWKDWKEKVVLLPVASNANEPLELLRQVSAERGLPLVLHDSQQQVADRFGAVTTPHLFVIDTAGLLRYQGAFDDTSFRQRFPTQSYLRDAVEAVLAGNDPDPAETLPYGCTIVRYTADASAES